MGAKVEVVEEYKNPGVHLDNRFDKSCNIKAVCKKGQSRFDLLRELRSFGV